jgi:hypothetical protein
MEAIICGNISFSGEHVKEFDGAQVMASIPKAEITSIKFSYGESVEKPVIQIIAGIVSCLLGFFIGVWPLAGYLSNLYMQRGGHIALIVFAIPLILIGIYLIVPVFSRCSYLLVNTQSGKRKLTMKDCSPSEIVTAARTFGYPIIERTEP